MEQDTFLWPVQKSPSRVTGAGEWPQSSIFPLPSPREFFVNPNSETKELRANFRGSKEFLANRIFCPLPHKRGTFSAPSSSLLYFSNPFSPRKLWALVCANKFFYGGVWEGRREDFCKGQCVFDNCWSCSNEKQNVQGRYSFYKICSMFYGTLK